MKISSAGYQALHGLSPPLLGNGEVGARRLPRHGSWASQLQVMFLVCSALMGFGARLCMDVASAGGPA